MKNEGKQRSFRDRFLNKKVLLIALLVVVVVGLVAVSIC